MDDDSVRLFRTGTGIIAEVDGRSYVVRHADWDVLFNTPNLRERLIEVVRERSPAPSFDRGDLLPPVGRQEVWAAGVTYIRSKTARMTEAQDAGGGDFYDRVYVADRPELFLKATPHRVVGHGADIRIRRDADWNVPEPELALAVNVDGSIFGYSIGNDMSSRDIEGDNPLYLPQAKVYDQSCGLGPGLFLPAGPLPPQTLIQLDILRGGTSVFSDEISLTEMKRSPDELVKYLYRDNSFPFGCFLLTGTGIVPPDSFTLHLGDVVRITIEPIGTLQNQVIQHHE
ncbi:MAG: fumarylacetoacetate hydrolase family protein [Rhodothermales bacterium]